MSIGRIRRLQKDAQDLEENIRKRSQLIQYEAIDPVPGMPPDKYLVTYYIRSIVDRSEDGEPIYGNRHQVQIYLPENYPRVAPALKWRTQIWHPNIHHITKEVCIDVNKWTPQRTLYETILMMGEMLKFKNVHLDPDTPPYPLDLEVANWCRWYIRKRGWNVFHQTDHRELLLAETEDSYRDSGYRNPATPLANDRHETGIRIRKPGPDSGISGRRNTFPLSSQSDSWDRSQSNIDEPAEARPPSAPPTERWNRVRIKRKPE